MKNRQDVARLCLKCSSRNHVATVCDAECASSEGNHHVTICYKQVDEKSRRSSQHEVGKQEG